jgi:hypothetical protein
LVGLLTLAEKKNHESEELRLAVAELLGVDKNSDEFTDVIGDLIWSGRCDADEMLSALNVAVAKNCGARFQLGASDDLKPAKSVTGLVNYERADSDAWRAPECWTCGFFNVVRTPRFQPEGNPS